MESKLLELKARLSSLEAIRTKLSVLNARYVGTFRQTDTYFNSPMGRLKLREIDNQKKALLIYYSREDISGPKKSEILLIDLEESEPFKTLFARLLGKRVIVVKKREIYTYEGTQIHLDSVQNLGLFIEFERRITEVKKDYTVLKELSTKFSIEGEDLIQGSYSDLLEREK